MFEVDGETELSLVVVDLHETMELLWWIIELLDYLCLEESLFKTQQSRLLGISNNPRKMNTCKMWLIGYVGYHMLLFSNLKTPPNATEEPFCSFIITTLLIIQNMITGPWRTRSYQTPGSLVAPWAPAPRGTG
jgi:hypothetical protein